MLQKKKVAKEKIYDAKKPIKIWDVDVNNIVISKFVETKNNLQPLIGYLDKIMKLLVLLLPKMGGYVKTFEVKDGDKDKKNKWMFFRIDDDKLLVKYKTIWTKIED